MITGYALIKYKDECIMPESISGGYCFKLKSENTLFISNRCENCFYDSLIKKGFNYAIIKFVIDEDTNFSCIQAVINGDRFSEIEVNVKRIFWIEETC